jgi:hypothetical protein
MGRGTATVAQEGDVAACPGTSTSTSCRTPNYMRSWPGRRFQKWDHMITRLLVNNMDKAFVELVMVIPNRLLATERNEAAIRR